MGTIDKGRMKKWVKRIGSNVNSIDDIYFLVKICCNIYSENRLIFILRLI